MCVGGGDEESNQAVRASSCFVVRRGLREVFCVPGMRVDKSGVFGFHSGSPRFYANLSLRVLSRDFHDLSDSMGRRLLVTRRRQHFIVVVVTGPVQVEYLEESKENTVYLPGCM